MGRFGLPFASLITYLIRRHQYRQAYRGRDLSIAIRKEVDKWKKRK